MNIAYSHMVRSDSQDDQAHLSAEQIVELATRGRRCRRYDEYIDHITVCPICRETYKQLLQAEASARAARKFSWAPVLRFGVPVAAAAMLILFFSLRALLGGGSEPSGLRQVNGIWYEGAARLPGWAFAAATQFSTPPELPTRTEQTLQPAIRLLRPDPANAALENLTPEFRWTPVPDAVRYRAWLERGDGQLRINLTVKGASATLPQNEPLKAGVLYRLTIEALAAGELAGDGLRTTYEFRTLTPDEQAQLRWARQNRAQAPRASAVIFYQLGLYTDALDTLNTLPNEPIIEQWRAIIQAQLNTRR